MTAQLDEVGHRWITGLANSNFQIHYESRKSNVEADALSGIDWEKCDEIIQDDSIQAIVATALTRHRTSHIDAIPCSPQAIESILPSIPEDTPIVSKASTQLSRHSCPKCPETELFVSETESKPDNSSHLGADEDLSLSPKCMTTSDWVEAQSRDKNVREIIHLFIVKKLQDQKGKETDSLQMKQFFRQ